MKYGGQTQINFNRETREARERKIRGDKDSASVNA
jgi:hypothetical protein